MQEAFGIVVIVVAVVGVVVAVICLAGSGAAYRQIGRGAFSIDGERLPSGPAAGTPAADAERDAEVRQMLEARNVRRERRGDEPLDVEAEVRRLNAEQMVIGSAEDAGLRDEIRQLVLARNLRRARKGQEPLDVEAEVERQLRGS